MSPPELDAPPAWRTLEFISDVHLNAAEPATAQAWVDYLGRTQADALFILGDLFEAWIGDDLLGADDEAGHFARRCVQALRALSQRCDLFIMHGNRDFLAGPALMQACGARLLEDPTVLSLDQQRFLLSHGDALCLDDPAYLQFRAQVRSEAWQRTFLARPLPERQALARQLREQSQEAQSRRYAGGLAYAEVDAAASRQALQEARALTLLHGHTHRPARHELGAGLSREVLSDWDAAATPPRTEVLRLQRQPGHGPRLERCPLA